ncbi:MAG: TIGR02147 family protein [Bacteroidia bacterium]
MVEISEFKKPVEFLKVYIESLPAKEKRGIRNRLAKAAGVFPSYLSLILREQRILNSDQALGIANYLCLEPWKKRYFLRMADLEKAASQQLRNELEKELYEIRLNNNQISEVVSHEQIQFTPEDLAKFYSSWIYVGIRLATVLPNCKSIPAIAHRLGLSVEECQSAMDFLIQKGICIKQNGHYSVGPQHMHLNHDSSFIENHHAQWRLLALQKHRQMNHEKELAYTMACTLSEEDILKIRNLLLKAIQDLRSITDPSPSETMYMLNLDWLRV